MFFGLTPLGTVHTAISLVALVAALIAFARDGAILPGNGLGKTYVITTVLTCLTGFGIFQHGGFGKPHVLGIVTLAVLAIAWLALRGGFGRVSAYVATASLSLTFFFHLIPGVTETFTRLPLAAPVFSSPEDPALQQVIGVVFVVFLIGLGVQLYRLHATRRLLPTAGVA